MMIYVIAVFLCNLSVLTSTRVSYCGSKMCKLTDDHTFCQYSRMFKDMAIASYYLARLSETSEIEDDFGKAREKVNHQEGIGPECTGYIETPLSPEEKLRIVARLNQRRAAAASGRLKGFPTAGNMFKLLWVDELAREAQLWADQCVPPSTPEKNDACRDLYSVSVGQCVASVVGEAPGLRPDSMVDLWYMQSIYYKGNVTFYEPPTERRFDYYGDFAQIVYSKSFMVGCGRSRFMATAQGRMRSIERLVCNFAPRGPTVGRPLWTVAGPTTACPPRSLPDNEIPALCRVLRFYDETLDPDRMMSPDENMLLDTIFELDKNESINYIGSIDELYLRKVAEAAIIGDDDISQTDNVPEQNSTETLSLSDNTPQTIDFEFKPSTEMKRVKHERKRTTFDYDWETETFQTHAIKKTTMRFDKLLLVGRPRSYQIEELTDDLVDTTHANRKLDMPDIAKKNKDFDIDYEFVEPEDTSEVSEIVTTTVKVPTTTTTEISTRKNITTVDVKVSSTEDSADFVELEVLTKAEVTNRTEEPLSLKPMNTDTLSTEPVSAKPENETAVTKNLASVAPNDSILYEYMSDPETMAQLQEELERSEREMSGHGHPPEQPMPQEMGPPLEQTSEDHPISSIALPIQHAIAAEMTPSQSLRREETETRERSDKVRRDLREHPSEEELFAMLAGNQDGPNRVESTGRNQQVHEQGIKHDDIQHEAIQQEARTYLESSPIPYRMRSPPDSQEMSMEDEKKNMDRTPVLNMVMRYMPYLRNYQNSFMKRAVNSSYRISHNFILVLLTLVLVIVL